MGGRNLPKRDRVSGSGAPLTGLTPAERFAHFWSRAKIQFEFYCWEWTGAINRDNGYGHYSQEGAHRVAYMLTFGEIPKGMRVCHRCDNHICVNPNHLFLGTAGDNNRDMFAKKRGAFYGGTANVSSRQNITEQDVRFIRSVYQPWKTTQRQISEQYGFPFFSVKCAVDRSKWKDVPWPS